MSSENPKASRRSKEAAPDAVETDRESTESVSSEEDNGSVSDSGTQRVEEPSGDEVVDSADAEADDIDARLEAILEEVPDAITDAVRQRDEYLDDLRRLQAEFENYRKRVARQAEEATDRATVAVLERILPALDALDMARSHAGDPSDEVAKLLTAALGQISSLLRDALAKDGLERIDEVGIDFDPAVHDAVSHEHSEDDDPQSVVVVEVLRPGYRLKGRVVRPAMVKVRG